jgi:prepilin signal peptidase PulO-like enzyme (type II secretory pathway)
LWVGIGGIAEPAMFSWWALLAGPIAALPLFGIWLVSRGTAMGLGDVKFMVGAGWILGIPGSLALLYIAFVLGALFGLGVIFMYPIVFRWICALVGNSSVRVSPILSRKMPIPFAPFLIFAFWAVFFSNIDIYHFLFL